MDGQLKRGMLDVCVLAAIRKEDSYGYQILKDLRPYVALSEWEQIVNIYQFILSTEGTEHDES